MTTKYSILTKSKLKFLTYIYHFYFRGKLLFGFSDHELQEKGGYDLIHPEDLSYYAAAHQECMLK